MMARHLRKLRILLVVHTALWHTGVCMATPTIKGSLRDKRQQGNYRKATDEYIALLQDVVEKHPTEFGYEFGRWTASRLSTYLLEQTGIHLSGKQINRILEKKNMSISGRNIA